MTIYFRNHSHRPIKNVLSILIESPLMISYVKKDLIVKYVAIELLKQITFEESTEPESDTESENE